MWVYQPSILDSASQGITGLFTKARLPRTILRVDMERLPLSKVANPVSTAHNLYQPYNHGSLEEK